MIETFVKRPVMTTMFVMVFVVLGLFSAGNLIIESTPKIEYPLVSVKAIYPGATPFDIESQVIEKMEDAISELSDIKKVKTQIFQNFGLILVEFKIGSDVNTKTMEVKDVINSISNDLPDDLKDPIIAKFNPLIAPVMELTITSRNMNDVALYEFVDDTIKQEFSSISGVASVNLYGGKKRQINIKLDSKKLSKYFLSLNDVVGTMARFNLNIPGGDILKNRNEINVRFEGEFARIIDIKKMPVVSPNGISVPLSKLGSITDGHEEISTIARFDQTPTIGISIMKNSDGDAIATAKNVKKKIDFLNNLYEDKIKIKTAFDSTIQILDDTRLSQLNIIFGILLTIVVMMAFLRDWRVTTVSALVIPTSLVSTFLLMDMAEFSLNIVTLLALGTVLGTLIANAIVIIESIMSELEKGLDPKDAAVSGTQKATLAVFASAGTNLVVFTPISFMGGVVGEFMKHFGLTVIFATLFSILASFTMTPMLCGILMKKRDKNPSKEKEKEEKFTDRLISSYIKTIITWKKTVLLICVALIFSPVALLTKLGSEFIPTSDEDTIQLNLSMPQGTPIEITGDQIAKIEAEVCNIKEVKSCLSSIGGNTPEDAYIIISLIPKSERDKSDVDLINEMYTKTSYFNLTDLHIVRRSNLAGGALNEGDISLEVYGKNYDELVRSSHILKEKMKESKIFRNLGSTYKEPKDEFVFIPNISSMVENGVTNDQVGRLLRIAISGNDDLIFRENNNEYPINIEVDDKYKKSEEDLLKLNIKTRHGIIPLKKLGNIVIKKSIPPINRRDGKRTITLFGNLHTLTSGEAQSLLIEKFKDVKLPKGATFKFAGNSEEFDDATQEMIRAFLIAVILTFMLLAAILDSWIHPLTIAISIFTAFVGVIYALYIFGFSINMGSMLTLIMLVGLSVNNAILLVERAVELHRRGHSINDSIKNAFKEKIRAILMTSIAIVVGVFPQIF